MARELGRRPEERFDDRLRAVRRRTCNKVGNRRHRGTHCFSHRGFGGSRRHTLVRCAHDELIPPSHLVVGDEPLEIPGGIRSASARRRLAQAHLVERPKDLGEGHVAAHSEIPGFRVAMTRAIEYQREGKIRRVFEIALVIPCQMRRQFTVTRGDPPNPTGGGVRLVAWGTDEMDIERSGLIDVTGPEEADVAVLKCRAAGNALKGQLDATGIEELITRTTLEAPVRCRRLVKLGCVIVDDAKLHGSVARFEQNSVLLGRAIVDVFEIKSGVARYEQIAGLSIVFERSNTMITGTVPGQYAVVHGAVVHDHDLDRAPAQFDVRCVRHGEVDARVGQRSARGWQGRAGGRALAVSSGHEREANERQCPHRLEEDLSSICSPASRCTLRPQ